MQFSYCSFLIMQTERNQPKDGSVSFDPEFIEWDGLIFSRVTLFPVPAWHSRKKQDGRG